MNWTEIIIEIPHSRIDEACDIAQMAVPYGFYLEDYSDIKAGALEIAHSTLIDRELLDKTADEPKIHLYIGELESPAEAFGYFEERLNAREIPYTASTKTVADSEWADCWKKYFKAAEIGERLLICPSWEDTENPDGRAVLRIDPGAAFGTGTHATTKLCLCALEKHLTSGSEMLDIGTGSGILSIAALLLGAKSALGVDIDPQSVKTARENGEINSMKPPALKFTQGNLTEAVTGKFNVIAANIVADAIISLSGQVRPFLAENGVFITSGILEIYKSEVEEALSANGFNIIEILQDSGWVCIICR